MWFGTDNGAISYNGYQVKAIPLSEKYVHGLAIDESENIFFSDEKGLHKYNSFTNKSEDITLPDNTGEIKSLAIKADDLYIGAEQGVFRYDLAHKELSPLSHAHKVNRLAIGKDGVLFASTDNSVIEIDLAKGKEIRRIEIPNIGPLLWDEHRRCLWIGGNGKFYKYQPETGKITSVIEADTFFKSIATAADNVYIGSDNGLFVYSPENDSIETLHHDVNNPQTIGNDVVWSLATDKTGNVWVGTSHGVSLIQQSKAYELLPISLFSRNIPGLHSDHFTAMLRDSRGNLWLGGNNGIIKESPDGNFKWYHKAATDNRHIPHNNIRNIYQGRSGEVWIASDGGLLRYDTSNDKFVPCQIRDKSGRESAEWVYDVYEDKNGKIWVATHTAGLFVVDKSKLLQPTVNVVADRIEDVGKADVKTIGNHSYYIKEDRYGRLWIAHKAGLAEIDPETMIVTDVSLLNEKGEVAHFGPQNVVVDDRNNLWYTINNRRLAKIDMATHQTELMPENAFGGAKVFHMICFDDALWGISGNEIVIYDISKAKCDRITIPDYDYISMAYDPIPGRVILGGYDALLSVSPDLRNDNIAESTIKITGLMGNGEPLPLDEGDLKFPANTSQVAFEISDFLYGKSGYNYEYRLSRGRDSSEGEWASLPDEDNVVMFHELTPGTYTLELRSSIAPDNVSIYQFKILPPWYLTIWAKILYWLIAIGIVAWWVFAILKRNRRRYEQMEKERTIELTRMKMDFFTNMSHELKTPLSLIIAPIDKLLKENKDAEITPQIEGVKKNALRLNSLIQKVLDFKQISGKDDTLLLSRIEMGLLVKSVADSFAQAASNRNITVSTNIPQEEIWVSADIFKIESVLYNILSNAIKFVADNTGQIKIDLTQQDKHNITISVADNGQGISKDDLNMVWMRLYQGRNKEKNPQGSGIGLYLVKKYVELHGGNVKMDSTVGIGTTVTLTLPMNNENQAAIVSNEVGITAETDPDKKKLLIIDDNSELREFINSAFALTYNCYLATNGEEGLQTAQEIRPDIIIVDEMMPVMSGMEFCRNVKKFAYLAPTPIIMLTAKDDADTEMASISVGADVFMSKPFDLARLTLRIEQLLESRKLTAQHTQQEQMVEQAAEVKEPLENSDERMMKEIIKVIEDNMGDPDFNVTMLCDKTGIASKKMLRLIKAQIGTTPVGFIRQIRMKKAALLLKQQRFSIAEVMYMVGFSHTSYFAKSFTEEFGMSPKEYMEKAE